MHEYEEELDDGMESEESKLEESREELLEEDEISSREEAFLKGYEDAHEDEEDTDKSEEE